MIDVQEAATKIRAASIDIIFAADLRGYTRIGFA
jgi:hypothetical protein